MSTSPTRSRWLDWAPKSRNLAESAESEPTKPSIHGFVGFEGDVQAESAKIETEPSQEAIDAAGKILAANGVRLMQLDGVPTVGLWSDLDGPYTRAALMRCGSGKWPVRYLDGAGIPVRYKLRHIPGEPVPLEVLAEMERLQANLMQADDRWEGCGPTPAEYPWVARDRMLKQAVWCSWAEWKAAALNRLFQEKGATGKPGRITAETVLDGERKRAKALAIETGSTDPASQT